MPSQKPSGPLRLRDKWLEFVGEGSANTVWAVHFTESSGGDAATRKLRDDCNGFLLRIQKHQTGLDGSDSSFSAHDQLSYLSSTILPLFSPDPSLIVTHRPIHLDQSLIDEANAVLAELDEKRAAHDDGNSHQPHSHLPLRGRKFTGSRVGPAGTHMLTEDFRPRNPRERFAEIKPKWLAQSPTAPRDARVCRNCAVAAKRFADAPEGKKPAKSDPEKYGCPLHLVSSPPAPGGEDPAEKDAAPGDWKTLAERIFRLSTFGQDAQDPRHAHFLFWVARQHELLRYLRALQARFAHGGTFLTTTEDNPDEDLLLAMTLRDCSLFFRYEVLEDDAEVNGQVKEKPMRFRLLDFKLADLDKKSPSKIPSWQETERGLIDGGWYDGKKDMPHCRLKRGPLDEGDGVDTSRLKDHQGLGAVYEE
ncbi:inositol-pentakisphosphate 2-kinase [Plectosphaerella cucumerina]|uniref:Inositol-pentakisphosphate 2-kinase n=1 Tax=Plectosphaerella cucumerina TaxID=40658 RepID=A0A8K0X994_9PEZI|nr:inositol-pentakisphosphate 2-kinase [Plectosphaerella cucumerina]